MLALASKPARWALVLFETDDCKTAGLRELRRGSQPAGGGDQVLALGLGPNAPWARLCTAQHSQATLRPDRVLASLERALQELLLQVAAGGPLQVGSKAIRTW